MKPLLITTVAVIMGLSLAATVEAKKDDHHGKRGDKYHEKMMKEIDTNNDGKIELSEHLSHAEQRFKKMDLDGDGFLAREEGEKAHKNMRKKMRKNMRKKHRENRKHDEDKVESE